MRKLLLSGASVALLSLGAASLPSLADSPSIFADPIGDAPRVQLADSGVIAPDATAEEAVDTAPTGHFAAEPVQPAETVMINEVLDADVIDINGEAVASVDDVLVAPNGRMTHVVVSYGGLFGIGAKQVLVPWESVSYNAARNTLQVPGSEADLEAAPGFVTQEELLDQQQVERARQGTPSLTGAPAPQQAQVPDPD